MNEFQYEELERYHSEQAAENYLRSLMPDQDDVILLATAADLLDLEDVGILTDRKGLERFSMLLLHDDGRLTIFAEKLKGEILNFENSLEQRDRSFEASDRHQPH